MFADNFGNKYHTQREAAEKTGVDRRNISAILCKIRKSGHGYKFYYLDNEND